MVSALCQQLAALERSQTTDYVSRNCPTATSTLSEGHSHCRAMQVIVTQFMISILVEAFQEAEENRTSMIGAVRHEIGASVPEMLVPDQCPFYQL